MRYFEFSCSKNVNITRHILGNVNDAGKKYCLTQAMQLVISLHILLFSLLKSSFRYVNQKKVQTRFYKFNLSATSLSSQKKVKIIKKIFSSVIENIRDLKRSKNKDNIKNKCLFLKILSFLNEIKNYIILSQ